MQLLTITNDNHEWYHKRKRRSSLRIIIALDENERASNTAENAPFIPWGASFLIKKILYEKSVDD